MDKRIRHDKVVCGKGEQSEMKKIWEKPKLIILLRGRPEEFVLAGCKMANSTGPLFNNNACARNKSCTQDCSVISTS
jgi:hypothetical protein